MMEEPSGKNSIISVSDQSLEDYACRFGSGEIDCRQLGAGRFRARTVAIDLQGVQLARRTTPLSFALLGKLADSLVFYFPLRNLPVFASGHLVDAGMQMVASPGQRIFAVMPDAHDQLLVRIEPAELQREFTPADARLFHQLAAAMDRSRINPQRKLSITRSLFEIFSTILYRRQALGAADIEGYRRAILQLLFDYLRAHGDGQRAQPSTQERLLQRALLHIEDIAPQAPGLDELAREVFASKRAVQYAFESIVGVSPMRYIKLHRLNLIRKELLAAGQDARMSHLVSKYGFSNLGRLSREYAELFGERPRDTANCNTLDSSPDPVAAVGGRIDARY